MAKRTVRTGMQFSVCLREEMLGVRKRRFQYQFAKVTAVGSLMGAGGLVVESYPNATFYYIIPFVAISFDWFLLGESFTLRRLSAFVRSDKARASRSEKDWEEFVKMNPDRFMKMANRLSTALCGIGAASLLALKSESIVNWMGHAGNILWIALLVGLFGGTWLTEESLARFRWNFSDNNPVG